MNDEINNQLIEGYLVSKKAENTIRNYRSILQSFANFIEKDLMEVKIEDISRYFKTIEKQAFSTYNLKLMCIRDFFGYYIDSGEYNKNNPTCRLKRMPTNKKAKTRALTYDECKALTKLIKEKIKKSKSDFQRNMQIRNHAIIQLLISGGFRIEELLQITFDNLDIGSCRITLEADETKGKKERVVNFEEKTFNYLIDYLDIRRDILKDKESKYVFLSKSGNVLDYSSWDDILEDYGKEIGINDISSHMARSTFVTNIFKATNNNLLKTMEYVGHSNISITARYVDLESDKDELIKIPTARL